MADLNIAIKIAAQDQASGVLGRIGGALKGLTGETGLAGRGFGGLQTAVSGLMGGMTLLLGGLVAVGGAAFGMANDVQAATALVQGQLGLGAEEAEAYGDVIKDVYGANFGESVAAVGTAVGEVSLQLARLGEVSTDVVEGATVNAFRLADAYGVGVTESTSAAVALMDEFGLSQQQAFDFLTTGLSAGDEFE
ncbi:MAG: hypothetical protein IPL28_25925 [Chloroflexi bacterium]|nr:hypothetical protein [Chloroflexota bacterium]